MSARRLTLLPRLALAGSAALFAASVVTSVTPDGVQYDDDTSITVAGYNFTAGSRVSIDTLTGLVPTAWTPTTLTVTVPQALATNSPLATAGSKPVVVSTGGSATWTVTSWSFGVNTGAAAFIANRKRVYVASQADCSSVGIGVAIPTWTDRTATADLTAAAGLEPQRYGNQVGTHDGVYCDASGYADWSGNPFTAGNYFVLMAMQLGAVNASDGAQRQYLYGANVGLYRRANVAGLRWFHSDTSNTTNLDTSGTLTDNQQIVLTARRDAADTVNGLSLRISDASGIGTAVTGAPYSADPSGSATYRLGAKGTAMEGSGARFAQILVCSGTANTAREERMAIREALLTTGLAP